MGSSEIWDKYTMSVALTMIKILPSEISIFNATRVVIDLEMSLQNLYSVLPSVVSALIQLTTMVTLKLPLQLLAFPV